MVMRVYTSNSSFPELYWTPVLMYAKCRRGCTISYGIEIWKSAKTLAQLRSLLLLPKISSCYSSPSSEQQTVSNLHFSSAWLSLSSWLGVIRASQAQTTFLWEIVAGLVVTQLRPLRMDILHLRMVWPTATSAVEAQSEVRTCLFNRVKLSC